MPVQKVVVDGSNIATEGRTIPSLAQLEEAVAAFQREFPEWEIAVVVVDATFAHRIEAPERPRFEEAYAHNELVCPPAGAIGRGDAFLLQIADRIGAVVFSNDSFQEFHGEYDWLFTEGRLMGGKPVPGVGWIFTPRTPVRGVKSRKAVKEARKKGAFGPTVSGAELGPPPVPTRPPPRKRGAPPPTKDKAAVARAIADATEAAMHPDDEAGGSGRRRRRRRRGGSGTGAPAADRPAEPVNEPLPFLSFLTEHPLGSQVDGEVDSFTSHGAFVLAGGARCYVPITALGNPPPRAAREVLTRGEVRTFTVQAFDAPRRGIELALPQFVHVSGAPTEETIEAEISTASTGRTSKAGAPARAGRTSAAARKTDGEQAAAPKKAAPKKAAAKKAPEKAAANEAPAKKAPAKKGPAKKAPAKKVAAAKAAAEKAPPKKVPAKKVPAKKVPAKKVPAKKAPAKKAPAEKPVPKKAAPKKAPAKKTAADKPAKKAVSKKAVAKKAPAKKSTETAGPRKNAGRSR